METNNLDIKIENLNFSYDKREILHNLNLQIQQGESIGLVGSNGAGKTTLFHLICGILKPKSGSINIMGEKVTSLKYNPKIGYVFQNPDDQLFSLTVIEDLTFGPLNIGLSRKEAYTKAQKYLQELELEHLAGKSPHHLSLGEKRMCSIASVLIMEPDIIILDEPTSNLDSHARREVINYLNKINHTKIIASHDLEFILETCSEVAILHHNTILVKDKTEKIFLDQEIMKKTNQEIPYSLLYKKVKI